MIDPLSRWIHDRSEIHGPLILMYHSVSKARDTPTWPWALSMVSFCEQLDFLRDSGYATPTVSELVAAPDRFDGRTAVITFDDGYTDNLLAAEELHRRDMRATFYMVAGAIGKEPHWTWDVVEGRPAGQLLEAKELRQMVNLGMEVGSHTVNHTRLPEIDDESLQMELVDSRSMLEQALGAPVTTFAYPYGLWDERCEIAVKAAGYSSACLTRTGWGMRDGDPWRLRRLTVFNDCSLGFFSRMLALASHEAGWDAMMGLLGRRVLGKWGKRQ